METEQILVLTLEKEYTTDEVYEHFDKRKLFRRTVSPYGNQMHIFKKNEYMVCATKLVNGLYKIYLFRIVIK